jgi:isopentenyldiphosphate isomerase
MSFIDRIRECNVCNLDHFTPFNIDGIQIGWLKPPLLERLRTFPEVFTIQDDSVSLAPDLDTLERRNDAVDGVLRALCTEGWFTSWRDEIYPVAPHWGAEPLLCMERVAVPHFGVRAYGVHMNAYVRKGEDLYMWIARRAWDKPTFPGMLDNLVAGGQPIGIGLRENLIKECAEEAGIPAGIAAQAVITGAVSYVAETKNGLKPDVMFVYDLELDSGFIPENRDGEHCEFYLKPVEEVRELVRDTTEFKFNCNLVIIHFLVRHGLISPANANYLEIIGGLQQPMPIR